jgi:SNF2 family DNA or RNA helicase
VSRTVRLRMWRLTCTRYQEEALDFIMQRESGPISEEYCLWKFSESTSYVRAVLLGAIGRLNKTRYRHSITGCERAERPVETGGGILADEMGLGKTLTMLAAIIRTAGTAKGFAYSIPNDVHLSVEQAFIPSRATLVVVPSPSKPSF